MTGEFGMADLGKLDVRNTPTITLAPCPPTLEEFDRWAPRWFADALGEATNGKPPDPARREIVFATCFLESYIIGVGA